MALALAGTRLARHSRAAVRHLLLAASFGVLLILPIASFIAPTVRIAMPAVVHQAIAPLDVEPGVETVASAAPTNGTSAARTGESRWAWPSLSALLIGGWLAGTIVFLVPVALGLWRVRVLRGSALPWLAGREVVDTLAAARRSGRS